MQRTLKKIVIAIDENFMKLTDRTILERDRLVCTRRKTNGDSPKVTRRRPPSKGRIPTGHLRPYCTSIAETIASPLVGLNSRITMPSLAFTSKCV